MTPWRVPRAATRAHPPHAAGQWFAAGVATLLVAGALVFYLAFLPGIVVDDYADAARGEHAMVASPMRLLADTFARESVRAGRR
jgi:hypothetical protein